MRCFRHGYLLACPALVLLLTSCSFYLKGSVRNETGREITMVVDRVSQILQPGAMSRVFNLRLEADSGYVWNVSVRSDGCVYTYDTPGTEGGGGAFPPAPVPFVLHRDMTLSAIEPESWKAIGRRLTRMPITPASSCSSANRE